MNWYRVLTKIAQETPYGYWVDPNGKEYSVQMYGHASKIRELGYKDYKDAWKAGWVRVVTDIEDEGGETYNRRGAECGCEGKTPINSAQVSTLTRLFKQSLCESVFVEIDTVRELVKAKFVYNALNKAVRSQDGLPSSTPTAAPTPPPAPVAPPAPVSRPAPPTIPPAAPAPAGGLTREQLRQRSRAKVNPLFAKK
jgi:hypothetical protein